MKDYKIISSILYFILFAVIKQPVFAQNEFTVSEFGNDFEINRLLNPETNDDIVSKARFEPFVIRWGQDFTKLTLHIKDPHIVGVKVFSPWFIYQNQSTNEVTLFDDGTHGDAEANDKIFTLGELLLDFDHRGASVHAEDVCQYQFHSFTLTLEYEDGSIITHQANLGTLCLCVVKSDLEIPVVNELAADSTYIQYSSHLISLTTKFDDNDLLVEGFDKTINRLFDILPEPIDFFIQFRPWSNDPFGGATFSHFKNDILGVGYKLFDEGIERGWHKSISGILTLYGFNRFEAINHELLHNWAVLYDWEDINHTMQYLDLGAAHWGVIERPTTGLGTFGPYNGVFPSISQVDDSTFYAYYDSISVEYPRPESDYNDLELYLMGLIPADSVKSPIKTLVNPISKGSIFETTPEYVIYKADSIRYVPMAELIQTIGERVPDYSSSTKEFKIVSFILCDRKLTEFEFAFLDNIVSDFEKPFSTSDLTYGITFQQATQGRAKVITSFEIQPTLIEKMNINPVVFSLSQNYPNPFNPTTKISYSLSRPGKVSLIVYNVLGQEVANLVNEEKPTGNYSIDFSAVNLSSGIYFYQLRINDFVETKKMIVLK